MRDPTRWTIVTRLTGLGADPGGRALAAQTRRDTTPVGRRSAFAAGAARGGPDTKRQYFERYFADSTLNEDWASASLDAFNAIEHQTITRPFLVPALDSLAFIQANRRIFFLGSWLSAFLGGQTEPEALAIVRGYLRDHPDLAADLRRKVLQYLDDLERTVRIRSRWSPASGAGN
jgi:aminopeptidase N